MKTSVIEPGGGAGSSAPALFPAASAIRFRALASPEPGFVMRAEIEAVVEEIKQSLRLLRRHL